jgi:deoxyribonuclease-4
MLGFHIDSNIDKLIYNIKKAKQNKCNIVQFFLSNKKENSIIYKLVKQCLKDNNMKCFIHISYTINIANTWDQYSWWIKQCITEIETAETLKAKAVVLHLGKKLDLEDNIAYNNMYSALLYIDKQTKNCKVKIYLETSSGQGSEMCYKMENLGYFYKKIKKNKRFGICIDTCHIFAAGYDITTKNKIKDFFIHFEKIIGLKYIKLCHLNDSNNILNSHIDRHANIGEGYIGKKSLITIYNMFKKQNIPVILETPDNNINFI